MNWIWKYEKVWEDDERKLDIKFELGVLPALLLLVAVVVLIWSPWS